MKAIRWIQDRRAPVVAVLASTFLAVLLLEALLRLAPGIVPPGFLFHFEPGLRSRMAAGRLPILNDTFLFDRDDGGPPLRLWKPFVKVPYRDFDRTGDRANSQTDEIGFCNPPGSYQQPTIDVVTLGDSFTWCNAIDPLDSWPLQLSELTGYATYNLGRGGVGLYEHLQILKRFGIAKKPRFVILNFYEGNDLRDAYRYHSYRYRRRDEKVRQSACRRE